MAIAFSIATFMSTLLGGLFALYLRDRLHLILGFSAGALLGAAFFDLIPGALELVRAADVHLVAGMIAMGFVAYMLLVRRIGCVLSLPEPAKARQYSESSR
jgi:ZIP family zinc transporter